MSEEDVDYQELVRILNETAKQSRKLKKQLKHSDIAENSSPYTVLEGNFDKAESLSSRVKELLRAGFFDEKDLEEKEKIREYAEHLNLVIKELSNRGLSNISSDEFGDLITNLNNITSRLEFLTAPHQFNEQEQEVRQLENRLREKEEELETLREELEGKVQEAEQVTNAAGAMVRQETGEAIGGIFQQKSTDIKKSARKWLGASLLSIGLLLWVSWEIYTDISGVSAGGLITLSKIALLLPVSVSVWFTVSNFSRLDKLRQDYEYKATISLSMMGFREILKEDVESDNQATVDFVLQTMEEIYSHPFKNIEGKKGEETPLPSSQESLMNFLNNLGRR